MSDIDEELLALAGDASSDEEEDAPMNISRSASPRSSTARKGPAKSRSSGHSDNEGMASRQSTPGSERSASMQESDDESDAGNSPLARDDRYPYESIFKDAADKAALMAMPEIEREQILAERSQEKIRDNQTRALRMLLQTRERENKKDEKKRKADEADLDADQRKTARQRTKIGGGRVGESSSGIETLKRARDEKADRQRRRQEDLDRNGGRRQNGHDSEDDEGQRSDIEWDEPARRDEYSPQPVKASPANLDDVEKVRVGRALFAQLAFYPGFEEAFTGSFARICIGPDKKTRENVYRMCTILGFAEGKPYAVEKPNGQTFVTNQYIKAAHGKAQRDWPFITCSNSRFTNEEWDRYQKVCSEEGVKIPTSEALEDKKAQITALQNRTWTDAEITERLRKQGLLNLRSNVAGLAKMRQQLSTAKALQQWDKVRELEAEINKLAPPKLAYGTSLDKKMSASAQKDSEQDRIARHNAEQRRKNNEEIKAAELRERAERRKQEAALARGENVVVDTSRRVRTRAVLTHDVKNPSGTTAPQVSTPKQEEKGATAEQVLPHIAKLQAEMNAKKAFGEISKTLNDDDVIGAMDLGIEIEL